MADAPSPLTYGTVIGHFISLLGDSADAGSTPDVLTRTGTVTISTNVKTLRISGAVNYLAAQEDIVAKIVDGELLAPDGLTPLRLLATDSPGVSPTPFQYTAQFSLTGVKVQPTPVTFSLPGGSTVDLSQTISIPAAPPVQTVYLTNGTDSFRWLGFFDNDGWIGTQIMPGDAYTDGTNVLVRAFAEHVYDGQINWGAVDYVAGTGPASVGNDGTIVLATDADALAGNDTEKAITPHTLRVVLDASPGGGGLPGTDFDIRLYGAVDMTGATDSSAAFLAALAAAQSGGGTLVIPPGTLRIDSQITLDHENDPGVTTGIQNQKSVRITGAGQSKNMNGRPDSGTILDLRYSGSGAKIQSFGTGIFEMDHLTLTDFGTSSTPFVLVTITIPKFHHLTVVGNQSKSQGTCDQDAFIFGGNTIIYDTSGTGPFGGYGGSVSSCNFDRIRRAVWCRVYATVNIFDNHINQASGAADGTAAAIDIDCDTAGVGFCNDNRVFNNYIETQGYVYGIAIRGGRNNTVVNNGFWDPTPGRTLASVYCSTTALNNLIVNLSEGETTIDFVDAHPGNNMFVGRDNTHGGMKIRGGVNFADTDKATLYEGALVVEGNGVDANAPLQVKPNQTAIPGDGAELVRVARHVGAGWHPGETAFAVRHDGTAVIPLPGTGVNMQDGYIHDGKLWKRWSAGNIDLDPSGGAVVCVNQTPFYAGTGTTAQRPTGVFDGAQYNDTTIGKPIWRFGGAWKDAAGNVV